MQGNLIKTRTKKQNKDGKDIYYTHFKIVLPNGLKLRVVPEYIPSDNIKDKEQRERVEQSNRDNAKLMFALADYETENNN